MGIVADSLTFWVAQAYIGVKAPTAPPMTDGSFVDHPHGLHEIAQFIVLVGVMFDLS